MTPEQRFGLFRKLFGIIRPKTISRTKANKAVAEIINHLNILCLIYVPHPHTSTTGNDLQYSCYGQYDPDSKGCFTAIEILMDYQCLQCKELKEKNKCS